eukprot:2104146-Pleurochrysis_carterae.AAC.1
MLRRSATPPSLARFHATSWQHLCRQQHALGPPPSSAEAECCAAARATFSLVAASYAPVASSTANVEGATFYVLGVAFDESLHVLAPLHAPAFGGARPLSVGAADAARSASRLLCG